jgi:antitoxin (DNA-binding transcriptional repressor) of toxin-antitoxin stability system
MAPAPTDDTPADLDFRWRERKGGEVEILHHGRLAATLRGHEAADFLQEAGSVDAADADAQQLMARLTGNYKRGNERTASRHPRNRR